MPQAQVLKITLEDVHPAYWRRIAVPLNTTYAQLHAIIQIAFEWNDAHLYAFYPAWNRKLSYESHADPALADDFVGADSAKYTIDQDLERGSVQYTYDFGADWNHRIKLEAVENVNHKLPYVMAGCGDGVLEDVFPGNAEWDPHDEFSLIQAKYYPDRANAELAEWARDQRFLPTQESAGAAVQNARDTLMTAQRRTRQRLMSPQLQLLDAGFAQSPEFKRIAGQPEIVRETACYALLMEIAQRRQQTNLRNWFTALQRVVHATETIDKLPQASSNAVCAIGGVYILYLARCGYFKQVPTTFKRLVADIN